MNITVTGDLGAGKSTVANVLFGRGWRVVSAGEVFRREALVRGLTLAELTELCRTDPATDHAIDRRIAEMGMQRDHTVFDSRLAFHFVPDALHVFLSCPLEVAAYRVVTAGRPLEHYATISEAQRALAWRRDEEQRRFKEMYGVDIRDETQFDLVVDATLVPSEIADIIEEYVARREEYAVSLER